MRRGGYVAGTFDTAAEQIQQQIDKLPTVEELSNMSLEEQQNIYMQLQDTYDAYVALTEEEKQTVSGAERFERLFDYFNGQIDPMGHSGNFPYGDFWIARQNLYYNTYYKVGESGSALTSTGANVNDYNIYFDETNKELTLNNVDLKNYILVPGGTTVILKGVNKLSGVTDATVEAITDGDLTIKGSGSLDITASGDNILVKDGDIIFEEGTITLTAGSKGTGALYIRYGNLEFRGNSSVTVNKGMVSSQYGCILIGDEAKVKLLNGDLRVDYDATDVEKKKKITISGNAEVECGTDASTNGEIYGGNGIDIKGNASVTARGLRSTGGSVEIDSTKVTTLNGDGIETDDIKTHDNKIWVKSNVVINSAWAGLYSKKGGAITVENCTLKMNGITNYGIYTTLSGEPVMIKDADVEINGVRTFTRGIEATQDKITIDNSTVKIAARYSFYNQNLDLKNSDSRRIYAGESEIKAVLIPDDNLTAEIAKSKYVKIEPATSHTITVNEGTTSKEKEVSDRTVTIKATVPAGYVFSKWNITPDNITFAEGSSALSPETSFIMPEANVTATAVFEEAQYEIHVAADDDAYGTATSSNAKAKAGDTITLTASPTNGYRFKEWAGLDGLTLVDETTTSDPTVKFTMPEKIVTATAKFEAMQYTVTLDADGGTIHSGNITSYTYGTGAALPADVTKTDYIFGGWYEDAGYSGDAVTEIADTETGNKQYFARWIPVDKYEIHVAVDDDAYGTATSSNAIAAAGDTITLTAAAKSGYKFKEWTGLDGLTLIDGTTASDQIVKFEMPENAVNATAYFEEADTYQLIVNGGNISGTAGAKRFEEGEKPTIQAAVPAEMIFEKWEIESGDAVIASASNASTTVTIGKEDSVITAVFKDIKDVITRIIDLIIKKKPVKTTYKKNEEFNPAGLVVQAKGVASPSDAEYTYTLSEDDDGYQLDTSEFDSSVPGEYDIHVRYAFDNGEDEVQNFEKSFTVEVLDEEPSEEEAYVSDIRIKRKPEKLTYYTDDEIDLTGLVVIAKQKGIDSGDTMEDKILSADEYDVEYNFSIPGTRKVTILYYNGGKDGDKTYRADFTVKVLRTYSSDGGSDDSDSSSNYTPRAASPWSQTGTNVWQYKKDDGTYAANEWIRTIENGKVVWYHFGTDAKMQTGWMTDPMDGQRYYLEPASGRMVIGWVMIDGVWYYFNETSPEVSGWLYDTAKKAWTFTGEGKQPLGMWIEDAVKEK